MLTMVEDDGTLRSGPRAAQYLELDSNFWFFTKAEAPKVDEVQHDQHVNLSYAAPNDQKYVSVSGTTQLARDRQKIAQFWNPLHKTWFPKGLNEPELAGLKVSGDQAQYQDSPSSAVLRLVGFVKAVVTGKLIETGENKNIEGSVAG